jgi:hypothetical protein
MNRGVIRRGYLGGKTTARKGAFTWPTRARPLSLASRSLFVHAVDADTIGLLWWRIAAWAAASRAIGTR